MTKTTTTWATAAALAVTAAIPAAAATVSPIPMGPSIIASSKVIDNEANGTVEHCLVLDSQSVAEAVVERSITEIHLPSIIEVNPDAVGQLMRDFAETGITTIANAPVGTVTAYYLNGASGKPTVINLTVGDIENKIEICGEKTPYHTKAPVITDAKDMFMSEVMGGSGSESGPIAIASAYSAARNPSIRNSSSSIGGSSFGGSSFGSVSIGGSLTGDTFITGDTFEITKVNITNIFKDNTTIIPPSPVSPSPVPVPLPGLLLLAGVAGLGAMARKKAGSQELSL